MFIINIAQMVNSNLLKNVLPGTNRQTRNMVVLGLVVLVIYYLYSRKSSMVARLHPSALDIKAAPSVDNGIFGLPYNLGCVPGPQASAGYYTKGLSPGGICGAQQYVAAQAGDYQILGGIGGSLLSPDQQQIMKNDIVDGAPQQ